LGRGKILDRTDPDYSIKNGGKPVGICVLAIQKFPEQVPRLFKQGMTHRIGERVMISPKKFLRIRMIGIQDGIYPPLQDNVFPL
jgi:hypothetical protein